jgi:hypothetical protein
MPTADGSVVRWRKRVVTGTSSFGPGLLLVDKLPGILVRCPKCGKQACVPYRQAESLNSAGGHYLKCRSCREKTRISDRVFVALLKEVMPAAYAEALR